MFKPADEIFNILMSEQHVNDTAEYVYSSYTKKRKTTLNI